ncbi:hypothetical protein V8B97DRAFT_2025198 [Scleroderma yunnanense]
MRLIDVKTFLHREELIRGKTKRVDRRTKVFENCDDEIADYAILSHRWLEQEVNHKLAEMEVRRCDGYQKILDGCEQAKRVGYEWMWVDTCYIDKRNRAELSEAINSRDGSTEQFPVLQRPTGDKKALAETLWHITRVPQQILKNELCSNRPCVAQTTTRVEDKVYSVLGPIGREYADVVGSNSPSSAGVNDQSIFTWGNSELDDERTGTCSQMQLMDLDDFIEELQNDMRIPDEELHLIKDIFPITNRGIQCSSLPWMTLPLPVFEAWLPSRPRPSDLPVQTTLVLWKSNYYRYFMPPYDEFPTERTLQFRQLYLRYQDKGHRNIIFEIDDSAIIENGNILTLTATDQIVKPTATLQWCLDNALTRIGYILSTR